MLRKVHCQPSLIHLSLVGVMVLPFDPRAKWLYYTPWYETSQIYNIYFKCAVFILSILHYLLKYLIKIDKN